MQRLSPDRAQDPPLWTLFPNKVSRSGSPSLSLSSLSLSSESPLAAAAPGPGRQPRLPGVSSDGSAFECVGDPYTALRREGALIHYSLKYCPGPAVVSGLRRCCPIWKAEMADRRLAAGGWVAKNRGKCFTQLASGTNPKQLHGRVLRLRES